MFNRITLAAKFNILTISLIIVTAVGISGFMLYMEVDKNERRLMEHGREIASILANSSEYGVYTENISELRKTIDNIAVTQDISYIAVLNKRGSVIYSKSDTPTERMTNIINKSLLILDGKSGFAAINDDETYGVGYVDIVEPVISRNKLSSNGDPLIDEVLTSAEVIGYVRILIRKIGVQQQIAEFTYAIAFITLTLILLGVILTLSMTKRFVSPLKTLVEATHAISRGDFDVINPQILPGELIELADSFNNMQGQMQQYKEEIDLKAEEAHLAEQQADDANKAKSLFLANMSHEIRTPMTAIVGYSELLLDKSISQQDKGRYIETIIRSGKHLLDLINDILDLSKIEANKLVMDITEVDIMEMVEDIGAIMQQKLVEKSINFGVNYKFPLPRIIKSDPVRLRQILLNLVSNAVKFTSRGYVYLNVSVDFKSQVLQIDVEDSGIGLTDEQKQTLFRKFAQADASTTRKYGGTGLGLAISRQLANKLGGDIIVNSEHNKGSVFTLYVDTGDLFYAPLVHSMNTAKSQTEKTATHTDFSGNVLLAEDNHDNQLLVSTLLGKLGVGVEIANNGEIAVKMAAQKQFDLILMDMQMPVMDGVTATKKLREAGYSNPIVALTANALTEDRNMCFEAGCNGFVTKPVTKKVLQETLQRFIPSPSTAKHPPPEKIPAAAAKRTQNSHRLESELLKSEPELADLVERFITRLPGYYQTLQDCFNKEDWDGVINMAHQLKGTGETYGFPILSVIATDLGLFAKQRLYNPFSQKLLELKSIVDRICGSDDTPEQSLAAGA